MGDIDQPVGLTKDAGWQIGVRKTFAINAEAAWQLLVSQEGLAAWLGPLGTIEEGVSFEFEDGVSGEVRVFKPGSHIRLGWNLPEWKRASTLQVRVIAKGDKSVIAFHQEHLPDQKMRRLRKAYFKEALDRLEQLASQSDSIFPGSAD